MDDQSILRIAESAIGVRHRSTFFAWLQADFERFIPHHLLVCGYRSCAQEPMQYEYFQDTPKPLDCIPTLTQPNHALLELAAREWCKNAQMAKLFEVDLASAQKWGVEDLMVSGRGQFLVHATHFANTDEIEKLFLFWDAKQRFNARCEHHLNLLLPYLRSTYEKICFSKQPTTITLTEKVPKKLSEGQLSDVLSQREQQVLSHIRQGLSNKEIGVRMHISAFTVKNHVQKILKKLGASNRVQAASMTL